MGSAGPKSPRYGELLDPMTGTDMVTVHYRGDGPAIPELLAGHPGHVRLRRHLGRADQGDAVRALAVTNASRTQLLPDLPPIGGFVPGYEGVGWQRSARPGARRRTSSTKLNGAINAGLAEPKYKTRLNDMGAEIFPGSPRRFRQVRRRLQWAKIIRA